MRKPILIVASLVIAAIGCYYLFSYIAVRMAYGQQVLQQTKEQRMSLWNALPKLSFH